MSVRMVANRISFRNTSEEFSIGIAFLNHLFYPSNSIVSKLNHFANESDLDLLTASSFHFLHKQVRIARPLRMKSFDHDLSAGERHFRRLTLRLIPSNQLTVPA